MADRELHRVGAGDEVEREAADALPRRHVLGVDLLDGLVELVALHALEHHAPQLFLVGAGILQLLEPTILVVLHLGLDELVVLHLQLLAAALGILDLLHQLVGQLERLELVLPVLVPRGLGRLQLLVDVVELGLGHAAAGHLLEHLLLLVGRRVELVEHLGHLVAPAVVERTDGLIHLVVGSLQLFLADRLPLDAVELLADLRLRHAHAAHDVGEALLPLRRPCALDRTVRGCDTAGIATRDRCLELVDASELARDLRELLVAEAGTREVLDVGRRELQRLELGLPLRAPATLPGSRCRIGRCDVATAADRIVALGGGNRGRVGIGMVRLRAGVGGASDVGIHGSLRRGRGMLAHLGSAVASGVRTGCAVVGCRRRTTSCVAGGGGGAAGVGGGGAGARGSMHRAARGGRIVVRVARRRCIAAGVGGLDRAGQPRRCRGRRLRRINRAHGVSPQVA